MLVCIADRSFGQHACLASLHTESTVTGYEFGATILYQTKKGMGAGFFYQTNARNIILELDARWYTGLFFHYALIRTKPLSLLGTLRAGIVNERFFVVVPGLESRITLTDRLDINLGMGIRMSYPAISGKIVIKLFPYENP